MIIVSVLLAGLATSDAPVSPAMPAEPVQTSRSSAPPALAVEAPVTISRSTARRVAAAGHAATMEPLATGFINALQVFPFRPGLVYRAYTAPGAVTDIALEPGERLVAVAAGDTARWIIGDTTSGSGATQRTHVLVKPVTAGLDTNAVITTDRRAYHLRLTASARTAMTGLSWTYPADQLLAFKPEPAEAAAPTMASPAATDPERLRFGYVLRGDTPAWRPLRVFDDGRQTFIEFPPTVSAGEAPPVFVLGADGEAELVNYRMRGRFYVVDRIFDRAELRLGTRRQQVVRIVRTGAELAGSRP